MLLVPSVASAYSRAMTINQTTDGQNMIFNFAALPASVGNISIRVDLYGDYYSGSGENAVIYSGATGGLLTLRGSQCNVAGQCAPQCNTSVSTTAGTRKYFTAPASNIGSSGMTVRVDLSSTVHYSQCSTSSPRVVVTLIYTSRPDLQVAVLSISPTSRHQGGTVNVTYRLRNAGYETATSTTRLYFSNNSTITPSDTYLNHQRTIALAAGAYSPTYTTTVTIPPTAATGTRYIGAYIDYNYQVTESVESNNTRAAAITVTPRPDLQVSNLTISPTSRPQGGTVSVTYRLRNAGSSAATATTRLLFSTNTTITNSDTYLNHQRTVTLAAGAYSAFYTQTVYLPANAATGTRYIGAYIDYNYQVAESVESNNTRYTPITITAAATRDLEVTVLSVTPTTAAQGATATITYRVRNNGTITASNFWTRLYFSTNNYISTTDTYLNHQRLLTLGPGVQSSTYTATVTIPATALTGARWVGGLADYNSAIAESNETNNRLAAPITITGRPDLQVTVLSVSPTTAAQGQNVTVTYRVRNAGSATASNFVTRLYFSTNTTITTYGDTYLNHQRTLTLAAGTNSATYSATVTIPATATTGARYIGAITDYNGAITESVETNNTRSTPITITARPDFQVSNLTVTPTSGPSGSTASVTYRLRNAGSASGTASTRLYFSTNTAITTTDTYLNHQRTLTLAAGAYSAYYTTTVTIPSSSNGTRYIGAIIDYNNAVTESLENNNTRYALFTVTSAPTRDLAVTVLSATPTTQQPGGNLSVTYRVRNYGTAAASSFALRLYLSTNVTITTTDTYLNHQRSFTSLAAGTNSPTYTTTVTIPSGYSTGTRYVGAIVDYANTVTESNEGNNTRAFAITVAGPTPDYVVQTLSVGSVGTTVTFSATVCNNGGATSTGTTMSVYYHSATAPSCATAKSQSFGVAGLAAGACTTHAFTRNGSPVGAFMAWARADSTCVLTESNENNNTNSAAYVVSTTVADAGVDGTTPPDATVAPDTIGPAPDMSTSDAVGPQPDMSTSDAVGPTPDMSTSDTVGPQPDMSMSDAVGPQPDITGNSDAVGPQPDGGSAGDSGTIEPPAEDGCSCEVSGGNTTTGLGLLLLLAVVLGLRLRRRRS